MMDKFIFYSTLKVSLSSGINSIWRSRFFWKRNWKHFWMKTWKHFFLKKTSSFVKFLTAVINVPASVLDPTAKQQLCFMFWLFCLKFLQMCQVIVQEFPKRKPADQQPGVYPTQPSRLRSSLETSQQLCHERTELPFRQNALQSTLFSTIHLPTPLKCLCVTFTLAQIKGNSIQANFHSVLQTQDCRWVPPYLVQLSAISPRCLLYRSHAPSTGYNCICPLSQPDPIKAVAASFV